MKRKVVLFSLLVTAILAQPLGALADDWFDHGDHDHNHSWSWQEYKEARRAWEHEHRAERRLTDAELRAEFGRLDTDHNHHLEREEAKAWGRW